MTTANHSNQISTSGSPNKNEHEGIDAFGEWVVVVRKTAPEKTEFGIHLPETARSKMEAEYAGKVVSIGEAVGARLPRLQLGDRIVYTRCFPMAKQGAKTEIFSLVHVGNIMGRITSEAITPGMAPENDKFKQD